MKLEYGMLQKQKIKLLHELFPDGMNVTVENVQRASRRVAVLDLAQSCLTPDGWKQYKTELHPYLTDGNKYYPKGRETYDQMEAVLFVSIYETEHSAEYA
jgi:hypothetical protein